VPVRYEARGEPCTRCGAPVSMRLITDDREPEVLRRRDAIHDDDGSPADEACLRVDRDAED
jgi:hypothetical protein